MRSFECAAYGIPQVVEARPQIENYFVPNEELLLFNTEQEMLASIESLLASPERSESIAMRARERVLGEHTYYHRIVALLGQHAAGAQLEEAFQKAMGCHVR